MAELNRVKYISEDFATYRAEADEFFRSNYPEAFNNLIATDLGNALMDQLSFAMQSLSFMVNRRASELYLDSARLNSSITKLARMLGYTISPASPATTSLTIQLAAQSVDIQIPVGFQFFTNGDISYEYRANAPFVIPSGTTSATLPVKEGKTKRITFVSDGTENQQFTLYGIPSDQFIYSDDLRLTVDGFEWTRSDLITFEATEQYEILFTDSPPKLRFGDGIAGLIPAAGSQIVVRFAYGHGLNGAIGSNQITSATPLFVNGKNIPLRFLNSVSNVGRNPEDIRSVRSLASTFFRTQAAAVIKDDYDDIAKKVSGVFLADAQTVRGVDADLTITQLLEEFNLIKAGIQADLTSKRSLLTDKAQEIKTQVMQEVTQEADKVAMTGLVSTATSGLEGVTAQISDAAESIGTADGTTEIQRLQTYVAAQTASSGKDQAVVDLQSLVTKKQAVNATINGLNSAMNSVDSVLSTLSDLSDSISGKVLTNVDVSAITAKIDELKGQIAFVSVDPRIVSMTQSQDELSDYLSYVLSDTSKANHVQVTVLSVDQNNRYVAPNQSTIAQVEAKLKPLTDAAVTLTVVDGSDRIVPVNLTVDIGVSQNAIKDEVETKSRQALLNATSDPFGLLVRRAAGKALYRSEIQEAITLANSSGDIAFINVFITSPSNQLDAAGNLLVQPQQIIQDGTITVRVTKRVIGNEEKPI